MPSAERIALVERLVRENKSNKEIAEILGIKESSVRSTIVKCGVERDKNRPCKMCGKPVGTANPKAMYCKECGRRMKSEYARKSAQRNMVEVTCGYCGKKFFGHESSKFCSKVCYQKAVSEGKYNKVENRVRRKPGEIDIEIRICGKTNDRMENVDYYEAREIWRKGWLGRGYAALVTVDGKLLDTIPKVTKFFGFRGKDIETLACGNPDRCVCRAAAVVHGVAVHTGTKGDGTGGGNRRRSCGARTSRILQRLAGRKELLS